jgi:hypothetical protein
MPPHILLVNLRLDRYDCRPHRVEDDIIHVCPVVNTKFFLLMMIHSVLVLWTMTDMVIPQSTVLAFPDRQSDRTATAIPRVVFS